MIVSAAAWGKTRSIKCLHLSNTITILLGGFLSVTMVEPVITNLEIPDHDGELSIVTRLLAKYFLFCRGGAGASRQSTTQLHHPLFRVGSFKAMWLQSPGQGGIHTAGQWQEKTKNLNKITQRQCLKGVMIRVWSRNFVKTRFNSVFVRKIEDLLYNTR